MAATEDSTTASTGPNRNNQFRRRYGIIGVSQGCCHVSGYRPRDQQHIGVFRGGNEVNSKSLQVIVGIGKGDDFSFAAIA
jgi:hypothetical protein